jgi:ATP-dependent Lon protease
MATALISALTKIPVRRDVAMTGEITLRGKVLPIGGLKEKAIAALRARVKRVIIPAANKKDLEEIPRNVKRRLKFVAVTDMDQVLGEAMIRSPFREGKKPETGKGRVRPPARLPVV